MLNAMQALYSRFIGRARYGGFGHRDSSELDYANANGWQEVWRNAAETQDVEGIRLDTNDRWRLGNAFFNPARQPLILNVALNAALGNNLAQTMFVANDDMSLTDILEIHSVAGTNGSAVTLTVTKETGTQAPGAGATVMTGTFNLKGTANTFQTGTLAYNYARKAPGGDGNGISLKSGDRLSILIAGTTTSLVGLQLVAYAQPGLLNPMAKLNIHLNADVVNTSFYLANEPRTIVAVKAIWGTKGTDAGAVTLDITKETGTTAPAGGTTILSSTISLKGTINTVNAGALSATASVLAMAPGNRLSFKLTGTATAVADLYLAVYFAPTPSNSFDVTLQVGINGNQGTDQGFFVADRLYEVVDISEIHGTAAGAALKGLVTQDSTTNAPGAGLAMHTDNSSAGFDLNGTANTAQIATLGNRRNRLIQRGERIGFKHSTTPGTLANLVVTATLRPM